MICPFMKVCYLTKNLVLYVCHLYDKIVNTSRKDLCLKHTLTRKKLMLSKKGNRYRHACFWNAYIQTYQSIIDGNWIVCLSALGITSLFSSSLRV
jgi:hypothetical protein